MYSSSGKFPEPCMESENQSHVSLNCGLASPPSWKRGVQHLIRALCSPELGGGWLCEYALPPVQEGSNLHGRARAGRAVPRFFLIQYAAYFLFIMLTWESC